MRKLARVEEIPPGHTLYLREANAPPLVLANWNGEIHALSGICPHRHNPLEGARVCDYLLDCPWHHFQFDVRTGENHYPRNVYPQDVPYLQAQLGSLRTYPVEVKGGEVWVDLE